MTNVSQPVYLVDADCDPAILKINGKANHTNCNPVGDFFRQVLEHGPSRVIVDFANCTSIDSTFLGVLAGAALAFNKHSEPRQLLLVRLDQQNRQLVKDLGLHRILTIAESLPDGDIKFTGLHDAGSSNANQATILKAHEDLCKADKDNLKKFQDVLTFLRQKDTDFQGC